MMNKQKRVLASAKKYASIGVPVMSLDSAKVSTDEVVKLILKHLEI